MSRYDRQQDRKRFLIAAGVVAFFLAIVIGFLWGAQQQAAPINNPGAGSAI